MHVRFPYDERLVYSSTALKAGRRFQTFTALDRITSNLLPRKEFHVGGGTKVNTVGSKVNMCDGSKV
ncbi:MAG: hypothetical protein O2960_11325, partial [Verrucomicrobia bacterium]|nr:hypothetical protein [Verrucomicrobiota bacterium]